MEDGLRKCEARNNKAATVQKELVAGIVEVVAREKGVLMGEEAKSRGKRASFHARGLDSATGRPVKTREHVKQAMEYSFVIGQGKFVAGLTCKELPNLVCLGRCCLLGGGNQKSTGGRRSMQRFN
jgi:hypothetical protein